MNKQTIVIALIAAGGLFVAGCGGDDVATLGGKNSQGPGKAQAETAKDMAECLQNAGIGAKAEAWDDTQAGLSFDTKEPYAMSLGDGMTMSFGNAKLSDAERETIEKQMYERIAKYDPSYADMSDGEGGGGAVHGSGGGSFVVEEPTESDTTEPDPAASDSAAAEPEEPEADVESEEPDIPTTPPYLLIGETDHTEAFVKCLNSSGYTEPVWNVDPKDELRQKQTSLEATTNWIKCARENGYPDLKDPPAPVADEYKTQPTALLPGDITEPELRALLKVCPNFDEEQTAAAAKEIDEVSAENMSQAEATELYEKIMEKYPLSITPTIGFDVPGYDGTSSMDGYQDLTEADIARLDALQQVLWEADTAYYEKRAAEEEAADEAE
jgi:hypothetical protein